MQGIKEAFHCCNFGELFLVVSEQFYEDRAGSDFLSCAKVNYLTRTDLAFS